MKAIKGDNKKSLSKIEKQRRGLLAMIHIAKKELGLKDDQYSAILRGFHVDSCAQMSIAQMEECVRLMKRLGWKPIRSGKGVDIDGQARALQNRAIDIASEIDNGKSRLGGLCKRICGVDQIGWCRNVERLKALVAALEKIRRTDLQTTD